MILFLIGLRGAGKSTVGRLVAGLLAVEFIDLDQKTAQVLGCGSASEALRARGLEAFRRAEAEALRELCARQSSGVVALGGGTPTADGAVEVLRGAQARIIYLSASAATLQARLRGDPQARPPLVGSDAITEVPELLRQRDELYRRIADVVIQTDELNPAATAALVVAQARIDHP